jgi:predicted metal-dependent RNase
MCHEFIANKVGREGAHMAIHRRNDDQINSFIIKIVPELRRRIKIAAAQSNLSEQEYIQHILEQTIPSETNFAQRRTGRLNRAAVDDLLRYREEIRRAHPGQVFEDSVELLRQAREERMRELERPGNGVCTPL